MEIKKILVTGSDGYIGSSLMQKLLERNYHPVGIDTQYFKDIALNNHNLNYETHDMDIRNIDKITLKGFDAIIHLAALSNDPMGEIDPQITLDINQHATIMLAKKAKKNGVKKFLFSSSCSIYGIAEKDTVDENTPPNPLTHYAKSKINAEKILKKLSDNSFHVHMLRNSTVYGYASKFRDDLVVNNLTACAYTLGTLNILSDGTPWRPLIDVRDLSDIFIAFLETDTIPNGECINIGFEENNVQVKDIVTKIHHVLPEATVNFATQKQNDKRSYKVDFTKFKALFPEIKQHWTLEKSIQNLLETFQEKNLTKEMFLQKKFTRLTHLKSLLEQGKLNNMLYWNP